MVLLMRALLAVLLLSMLSCGGKSSGYIPVESPIMEFEPPEVSELVEEEEGAAEEDEEWSGEDLLDASGDDEAQPKAPKAPKERAPGKSGKK